MNQPIYICGPTASGKTALAIEMAKLTDGEVINADAYQVYKGMEIISAAPSKDELAQAPHHLYGVLSADQLCDAMAYREMAQAVIKEVQSRGKTPIITGGSGMYLKFLTHGPSPVPASDETLRAELETKEDDELIKQLTELDPEGAASTNLQNRRYVIRALEICLLSGQKMSALKSTWKEANEEVEKDLRGIYLIWDTKTLRQRINLRSEIMLSSGAIEEVENLPAASVTCEKAIGVPQIRAHLAGEISLEECTELIAAATRQYAKRQRTWFRKETWLTACDIDEHTDMAQLANTFSI
ncbi:tRNA (adenosine(37)-N6)-dimethylallyltransferase MiaA [Akkermansiaceae bacterium]|nr:tRNA (adenosine(37)-N6)-dimethylallyltransferase MiaA [Akkermansiaceae bacterium]